MDIPAEFQKDLESIRETNRILYWDIVEELQTDKPDDQYLDALLGELNHIVDARRRRQAEELEKLKPEPGKETAKDPEIEKSGEIASEEELLVALKSAAPFPLPPVDRLMLRKGSASAATVDLEVQWRGIARLLGVLLTLLVVSHATWSFAVGRLGEHVKSLLSPSSPLRDITFDVTSLAQEPFLNFYGYLQQSGESAATSETTDPAAPGLGEIVLALQRLQAPTLFNLIPLEADWKKVRALQDAVNLLKRRQAAGAEAQDASSVSQRLAEINGILQKDLLLPLVVQESRLGSGLQYRVYWNRHHSVFGNRTVADAFCSRIWQHTVNID